jgi:hypothetical protein
VDEEIGNICSSGSVGDLPITAFGPLAQQNSYYQNDKDQLRVEHLRNVASETERVITTLTTNFGDLSDIDQNGGIDVFISPDVNRRNFIPQYTNERDLFRATLIYKPEDLANYNSISNPTSNEGEIVYLWSPDPAGLYNYGLYPSSNSLATNYAKGYIGSQVMNLINFNSHLLVQKGKAEQQWLVDSLGLLASAYVAGNSYSGTGLGHYLASQPQTFSLTENINTARIKDIYHAYTREGQLGMETMFGWYLHSVLCGADSVEPCAKIKDLVASDKVGVPNVEAVLGLDFAKVLENFGASVGVTMTKKGPAIRALFDGSNPDFPAPVAMPELTEILKKSPPQTFELSPDAATSSAGNDRAVAGPFPSYDSMLFQAIFPDSDRDFKLEKNSVTYVLLTGLLEKETDVTAQLGPNLNVAVVPIGDRDGTKRRIHEEKLSEAGHLDLRPHNLTDTQDLKTTYLGPILHSEDYTVTKNREIWAVGSVDNYSIDVELADQKIGDSDGYEVSFDPCEGNATCEAPGWQRIFVQVIPQDFHLALEPFSFASLPDLDIFRGQSMWGRVNEMDRAYVEPEKTTGIMCQSQYFYTKNIADVNKCANGGLTKEDFQTKVCGTFGSSACPLGTDEQATSFNHWVYQTYTNGHGAFYDNFFHSGPFGYPFYTHDTILFEGAPPKAAVRGFYKEEARRQFLTFDFSKDLKQNTFLFYPSYAGTTAGNVSLDMDELSELKQLTNDEIADLFFMRKFIIAGNRPTTDEDKSTFRDACVALEISEAICTGDASQNDALDLAIVAKLSEQYRSILCRPKVACYGIELASAAPPSRVWIVPERVINYEDYAQVPSFVTFYDPVFPIDKKGACSGEDVSSAPGIRCSIDKDKFMRDGDIRTQLAVPASRVDETGSLGRLGADFAVSMDDSVWTYKFRGEDGKGLGSRGLMFSFMDQALTTQRPRLRPLRAAPEAGELGSFANRYHMFYFKVPSTGANTVNFVVGGLKFSQGKYILRARVKDFDVPITPN